MELSSSEIFILHAHMQQCRKCRLSFNCAKILSIFFARSLTTRRPDLLLTFMARHGHFRGHRATPYVHLTSDAGTVQSLHAMYVLVTNPFSEDGGVHLRNNPPHSNTILGVRARGQSPRRNDRLAERKLFEIF
jgi:hypothetical protein